MVLFMVLFGMSIAVMVLWDVLDRARFERRIAPNEAYVGPKTPPRLEESQPVSSALYCLRGCVLSLCFRCSRTGCHSNTIYLRERPPMGKWRPQEIMLRFTGGSAVDLAYKFRNTNRGGVTLESWLRACQSLI